jgi:hypothetical protein
VGSTGSISQRFLTAEQFVIDLADFIKGLLDLGIGGQALAGLRDLVGGFEQQRLDLAFTEAAVEVKERAVLGTAGVALTLGLTAAEKTFEQGSVKEMGGQLEGAEQMRLALAQGQGGGAAELASPTHTYA